MARVATCIECGVELGEERVRLGYRYCTSARCQARHHRGVVVTGIGVNKSAETFIVADSDEIRRRGEAGEFGRKDAALGLDYRARPPATGAPRSPSPDAGASRPPLQPRRQARQPWSPAQENIVRLYHGMGLSPRQIAERAKKTAPQLRISERLAVQILSSRGR